MNDDFVLPPKLPNQDKQTTSTTDNDQAAPIGNVITPDKATYTSPKNSNKTHNFWRWELSRKQFVLLIAGLIILVVAAVFGGYYLYKHITKVPTEKAASKAKAVEKPKPTTEPSKLTGVEVPIDINKRPITGVMIENSPDSRPQAGLKDAGVVFEAIAEGGITRFLALYQEVQPDHIGPVRSARPYYLDWALGFDASYAHVGGSPEALALIKSLGVRDLDQFANPKAYQRVTSRYAPHNVYTSFGQLNELNAAKGFHNSNFTPMVRKKAEQPSAQPSAKTIDIKISSYLYNVHYDYDSASNSYKRSEGNKPHVDERSNAQIAPKVVVALVIPRSIASDGKHTVYGTIGGGNMVVFQDGVAASGTWKKTDRKAQITFADAKGTPIKLNPGQTWFTMVDGDGSVTSSP